MPGAVAPGQRADDIVQRMDADLLAFSLRNVSDSAVGGAWGPLLFVVSTAVSHGAPTGGAGDAVREVELTLRDDVLFSTPLEGGTAVASCMLRRLRNMLPLGLAGGSAQLVSYVVLDPVTKKVDAAGSDDGIPMMQRTRVRSRRSKTAVSSNSKQMPADA